MDILGALSASLLSPMALAFALGVIATLLKSDLKFPEALYQSLTIYLLFAIGLKGGVKLAETPFQEFIWPALAAIALCCVIPVWSFYILRLKFQTSDAAAIAAHYGSVSAVTFSEGLAFLDMLKVGYEGFMPALLAIMEIPAILIAILFARSKMVPDDGGERPGWGKLLHELFAGKSALLLIGGLVIGAVSGQKGYEGIAPFYGDIFRGALVLFLIEAGLVTGRRLKEIRAAGPFLITFALVAPLLHGLLGTYVGFLVGLSAGGATILGTLAASASYIAAPAAVRIAIPDASPSYYLTASLAITFPFNVAIGIPIYYSFAKLLYPES